VFFELYVFVLRVRFYIKNKTTVLVDVYFMIHTTETSTFESNRNDEVSDLPITRALCAAAAVLRFGRAL